MELQLLSLNVGQVGVIGIQHGEPVLSGIGKQSVIPPELFVRAQGLDGDEQADRSVHGGTDKAVYAYPSEHWHWWQTEKKLVCGPATFGENLTLAGATESDVAIGDTFQWGEAVLEISQPRAPCFKLALHTARPDVPGLMTQSARCGWYMRVLREGRSAGRLTRILASGGPSVRDAFLALYDPRAGRELAQSVFGRPELAVAWKAGLARKLR